MDVYLIFAIVVVIATLAFGIWRHRNKSAYEKLQFTGNWVLLLGSLILLEGREIWWLKITGCVLMALVPFLLYLLPKYLGLKAPEPEFEFTSLDLNGKDTKTYE